MPRDGSGVYSLPEAAFAANTPAVASKVNNNFSDVATALTGSVARDGTGSMSGNLNMGSNRITAVAAGTAVNDAPTVAQVQNGAVTYAGTGGGTANAQTATFATVVPAAYAAGQRWQFIAGATNTGATTLNVNALGAKSVVRADGSTALTGGEIQSGSLVSAVYDGTNFRLENPPVIALQATQTASGTGVVFTGIPAGVNRIIVTLNGVSTNGTPAIGVVLGTGGALQTSGYSGSGSVIPNGASPTGLQYTNGFFFGDNNNLAAASFAGTVTLVRQSGNTWIATGLVHRTDVVQQQMTAGVVTISGTVDRVALVINGAGSFDQGTVGASWEF